MSRVLLLTTGQCEHKALGPALRRLFPYAEIDARRLDGFTSRALTEQPLLAPGTSLLTLAAEIVAAVQPGERRRPLPDLVLLVEDVELANQAAPQRVVQHLGAAVRAHIERHPWPSEQSRQCAIERVRARCSFHLLCPMLEAYFFAEPDRPERPGAPGRAGALRPARFEPASRDVEDFETADEGFLAVPDRSCYADGRRAEWSTPDRARHPKQYLRYLCEPDLATTSPRPYKETHGGCAALQHLDWSVVLQPAAHARFLRSLLDDVADALGERVPIPAGELHPLTCRKPGQGAYVLRNV